MNHSSEVKREGRVADNGREDRELGGRSERGGDAMGLTEDFPEGGDAFRRHLEGDLRVARALGGAVHAGHASPAPLPRQHGDRSAGRSTIEPTMRQP